MTSTTGRSSRSPKSKTRPSSRSQSSPRKKKPSVAYVFSDGEEALYVNGKLVVENQRLHVVAVLEALGIAYEEVDLGTFYDYYFPPSLAEVRQDARVRHE